MKSVILTLGNKFRSWFTNLRIWAAFLLGITILLSYASRYLSLAGELGKPIQYFEAYLYVASQPRSYCFMMLGGLLLMSDAPFLTPISQQEMLRIGRRKWLAGQILYIFLGCLAYFFILSIIGGIYTSCKVQTYLLGGWSNMMAVLAFQQPYGAAYGYSVSFPFPEMVEAISPIIAVGCSLLLNAGYLSLVSLLILSGNLIFKVNCGWVIGSVFHFVNYMILANGNFGMNVRDSLLCCSMLGFQFIPGFGHLYCTGKLLFGLVVVMAISLLNTNRIEPFEYI